MFDNFLSQSIIENIGYYVYCLKDPVDNKVFYIGKGSGTRIFDHLNEALKDESENLKLEQIRRIKLENRQVEHFIIRHGLTEGEAFHVEAALIDLVGLDNLTNIQNGHYAKDYGINRIEAIIAMYEVEDIPENVGLPFMIININKQFKPGMSQEQLYQAVKESWVLGKNREKAKYVVPCYRGLTREVYRIENWYSHMINGKVRWGFNGPVEKDESIRNKLVYKKYLFGKGAANPVRYFNCDK